MNKHLALVLGTIFSVTILLVPFTGAFASSDTSVALPQFVFSLMFQSVTTPTFVDVTNYNAATGTTSSGSSVSLANSVGSYSQINRTGIPVAQNLICIKFSIVNPTEHFFDDVSIEPYINGSPAHLYGTYTQSDYNNQIDYYMFFYIGEDSHRVKDGSGQDITPWGIRITTNAVRDYSWSYSSSTTTFYYYNYTLQSQTIDPGEAASLALDIINVLQMSQIAEALNITVEDLDISSINTLLTSIDNNIYSVLNNSEDIEQILSDTYSKLSDQYDLISLLYSYTVNSDLISTTRNFAYYNNLKCTIWNDDGTAASEYNFNENSNGYFYPIDHKFTVSLHLTSAEPVYYITIPMSGAYNFRFTAHYYFDNDITNYLDRQMYNCLCVVQNGYVYVILYDYVYYRNPTTLHIVFDAPIQLNTNRYLGVNLNLSQYSYQFTSGIRRNFYERVLLYLSQYLPILAFGNNNSIPSDVLQTTDEINQNATTVNDFQSSTQQSLDQNLNDVPVVDYQIQATTGTQYMKAYSEALFNASNGFRIWYMLPLILFVIGMLIRWGVKK